MDAETMYNYEALAKRARYYKPDEKGVAAMCKIMEDLCRWHRQITDNLIPKHQRKGVWGSEPYAFLRLMEGTIVNRTAFIFLGEGKKRCFEKDS